MAHGDAREGKWRGNWRMGWVACTLHTTSEHGVSSITTADAHSSAASSRLNWRPTADLNGLVRFAERRNLFSARVPSRFNWPLRLTFTCRRQPCASLRTELPPATSTPVRTAALYQSAGCHSISLQDTVVSAVIHKQTIPIREEGSFCVDVTQCVC